MTLQEALTRLEVMQEQLDQERLENSRLHMQIGELMQRLADAKAALAAPAPQNPRGAGRPQFNQEMQARLEQFEYLRAANYSQADIMETMRICRATYYNYIKACKEIKNM